MDAVVIRSAEPRDRDALIEQLLGLRRLSIGVLAGNLAAERLYTRHGFRPHAIELEKPLTS